MTKFSIIIPTCNPTGAVAKLLVSLGEALSRIESPGDWEMVVVGDSGAAWPILPLLCRAVETNQRSACHKRNIGALNATGSVGFYFLDDDVAITQETLLALVTEVYRHPGAVIQGVPYRDLNSRSFLSRAEAVLYAKRFLRYWPVRPQLDPRNLYMPRAVFEQNRFPEFLRYAGEGFWLADKLRRSGFRFVLSKRMIVRHANRETLGALAKQKFNHGMGRATMRQAGDPDFACRYSFRARVKDHFLTPLFGLGTGAHLLLKIYAIVTNCIFWSGYFFGRLTLALAGPGTGENDS